MDAKKEKQPGIGTQGDPRTHDRESSANSRRRSAKISTSQRRGGCESDAVRAQDVEATLGDKLERVCPGQVQPDDRHRREGKLSCEAENGVEKFRVAVCNTLAEGNSWRSSKIMTDTKLSIREIEHCATSGAPGVPLLLLVFFGWNHERCSD